jgi:hypothetical protein
VGKLLNTSYPKPGKKEKYFPEAGKLLLINYPISRIIKG